MMKTAISIAVFSMLPLMSIYDVPPPESEAVMPAIRSAQALLADAKEQEFKSEDALEALEQAQAWIERAIQALDAEKEEEAAILLERIPLQVRLARIMEQAFEMEQKADESEIEALKAVKSSKAAKHAFEIAIEQLQGARATDSDPPQSMEPPSSPVEEKQTDGGDDAP